MDEDIEKIINGYSINYDRSLFSQIIKDFKSREEQREDLNLKRNKRLTEIREQEQSKKEDAAKLIQAVVRGNKGREYAERMAQEKASEEAEKAERDRIEAQEAQEAAEASKIARSKALKEEENKRKLDEERRKLEDDTFKRKINSLEDLDDILGDRYNYIKNPECIKIFESILKNTVAFVKEKLIDSNLDKETFLNFFRLVEYEGEEIRVPYNKNFEKILYSFIREQEKKSFEENCIRDYNIVYNIIEYCLFILGNKKYNSFKKFLNQVKDELDKIKEKSGITDFYKFIKMKKKYDNLQDCITSPFNNL